MSKRVFGPPRAPFFLADSATPNALGKVFFYEPGPGSTVKKAIYDHLGNELNNPYVLNAGGWPNDSIVPNGDYRILVTDSSGGVGLPGVTVSDDPHFQAPDILEQFGDWSSDVTYKTDEFCRASSGKYYQGIGPNNKGNDPDIYPQKWSEVYFLGVYSQYRTYSKNEIVKEGDDLFVSTSDGNIGNTPSSSSSVWRSFFVPSKISGVVGTTFEYRLETGEPVAGSIFDIDIEIPASTWQSIGPTGSGADNIWSALDDVPTYAKYIIFRLNSKITRIVDPVLEAVQALKYREVGSSAGGLLLASHTVYGSLLSPGSDVEGNEVVMLVDDLNRFEIYHESLNANTATSFLSLRGYRV